MVHVSDKKLRNGGIPSRRAASVDRLLPRAGRAPPVRCRADVPGQGAGGVGIRRLAGSNNTTTFRSPASRRRSPASRRLSRHPQPLLGSTESGIAARCHTRFTAAFPIRYVAAMSTTGSGETGTTSAISSVRPVYLFGGSSSSREIARHGSEARPRTTTTTTPPVLESLSRHRRRFRSAGRARCSCRRIIQMIGRLRTRGAQDVARQFRMRYRVRPGVVVGEASAAAEIPSTKVRSLFTFASVSRRPRNADAAGRRLRIYLVVTSRRTHCLPDTAVRRREFGRAPQGSLVERRSGSRITATSRPAALFSSSGRSSRSAVVGETATQECTTRRHPPAGARCRVSSTARLTVTSSSSPKRSRPVGGPAQHLHRSGDEVLPGASAFNGPGYQASMASRRSS